MILQWLSCLSRENWAHWKRERGWSGAKAQHIFLAWWSLWCLYFCTHSQGFHVIPLIPLGMGYSSRCPSQIQDDVLKLLLSAATHCPQLIQMGCIGWRFKMPWVGYIDFTKQLYHILAVWLWASQEWLLCPPLLDCEIKNSATVICITHRSVRASTQPKPSNCSSPPFPVSTLTTN